MLSHMVKPYGCEVCEKHFAQKVSFEAHVKAIHFKT